MRAVLVDREGADNSLRIGEIEAPVLTGDDLLIRVRATAVNRADLLQRRGLYPPPPGASSILGLECVGEVVQAGANVVGWEQGARAMALLTGGGYAEEVVVDAGSAMPVPNVLSDDEAGAFPETFLTAYLNIFILGEPPANGVVLVHGGGSGVGTAATTLCKEAGLTVLVTAGSEEKCRRCREHGADAAFNYREGDFTPFVIEATRGQGADVLLDCVGGRYLASNIASLAPKGRLVVIGLLGGSRGEIDLAPLLLKRLRVIGSTLRGCSPQEKAQIVRAFLGRFGDALREGRLRPAIDRVLPIDRVDEAHRLVQDSAHFGKVVLRMSW